MAENDRTIVADSHMRLSIDKITDEALQQTRLSVVVVDADCSGCCWMRRTS